MLNALAKCHPMFTSLRDDGVAAAMVNSTAERLNVSVSFANGATYAAEFDEAALQRVKVSGINYPVNTTTSTATTGTSAASNFGSATWPYFFEAIEDAFINGRVVVQKAKANAHGAIPGSILTAGGASAMSSSTGTGVASNVAAAPPKEGVIGRGYSSVVLICVLHPADMDAAVVGNSGSGLVVSGPSGIITVGRTAFGETASSSTSVASPMGMYGAMANVGQSGRTIGDAAGSTNSFSESGSGATLSTNSNGLKSPMIPMINLRGRGVAFLLHDANCETVQQMVLDSLMEYQFLTTHLKVANRETDDIRKEEKEFSVQIESLEREAKTLKESNAREKEKCNAYRSRLSDLQIILAQSEDEQRTKQNYLGDQAGAQRDTNGVGVDAFGWRGGSLANNNRIDGGVARLNGGIAQDDVNERGLLANLSPAKQTEESVLRIINPLGDRHHKDYDRDLFRLIKSRWVTGDRSTLDMPCNRVMRPYTASELITQTRNLSPPVRETVWQCLDRLDEWEYSVFTVQKAMSGDDNQSLRRQPAGGSLLVTVFALLFRHGLMQRFNIDEQVALNWISVIEAGYHANPYHNSMHAADVTQIVHYILTKGGLAETCKLSKEYLFAALVAAAIHDYDHPGINNSFHMKTQSYLATLYNDRSVLENHHVFCAFELMKLPRFDILQSFSADTRRELRETIITMVLATDMGMHAQYVERFKNRLAETRTFSDKEDQRLALAVALKMADISNSGRTLDVYLKWSARVSDEFYLQGDRERNMGITCSPFMDRLQPTLAKGQIAFISYIVIPFFEQVVELLPDMRLAVTYAEQNKAYWADHPKD